MLGGITFEEVAAVAAFNAKEGERGLRVVLGGSFIHNSTRRVRAPPGPALPAYHLLFRPMPTASSMNCRISRAARR